MRLNATTFGDNRLKMNLARKAASVSRIDSMSVIALIDAMSSQFTNVDWKISQFIASYPHDFCNMTAIEIARKAGVSDASVIRFAQKIVFDGFQELRSRLRHELTQIQNKPTVEITQTLQESFIGTISSLLSEMDQMDVERFAQYANACDTLLIFGSGNASSLAEALSTKLMLLGIKAFAVKDSRSMEAQAGVASGKNLFLLLDLAGDEGHLERSATIAQSKNARIVTISSQRDAALQGLSDVYFLLPGSLNPNSAPSISIESLAMVACDVLLNALLGLRRDGRADLLAKGGSLIDAAEVRSGGFGDPIFAL